MKTTNYYIGTISFKLNNNFSIKLLNILRTKYKTIIKRERVELCNTILGNKEHAITLTIEGKGDRLIETIGTYYCAQPRPRNFIISCCIHFCNKISVGAYYLNSNGMNINELSI